MTMYPNSNSRPIDLEYGTDEKAVFNFFNAVYAWMAVGLAVTAAVAYLVSHSMSLMVTLYSKGAIVAILLGTWALAYGIRKAALNLSAAVATVLFLVYAALIGSIMSYIFIIYKMETIGAAFVLTAGTFGAMSLYGYFTKADLTRIGSFLVMAAIGLFIASIVNIFLANNALSWLITYAVVGVFVGLTAYYTQNLKQIAFEVQGNADLAGRYAIIGSLMLYVAFINLFEAILRILGSRR